MFKILGGYELSQVSFPSTRYKLLLKTSLFWVGIFASEEGAGALYLHLCLSDQNIHAGKPWNLSSSSRNIHLSSLVRCSSAGLQTWGALGLTAHLAQFANLNLPKLYIYAIITHCPLLPSETGRVFKFSPLEHV